MEAEMDYVNGEPVPQMLVKTDTKMRCDHMGTVCVEAGTLTIIGKLFGALNIKSGASAIVVGKQFGSVHLDNAAELIVKGYVFGSMDVEEGASIRIEEGGVYKGVLNNNGQIVVAGVSSEMQRGQGVLTMEGNGYLDPTS